GSSPAASRRPDSSRSTPRGLVREESVSPRTAGRSGKPPLRSLRPASGGRAWRVASPALRVHSLSPAGPPARLSLLPPASPTGIRDPPRQPAAPDRFAAARETGRGEAGHGGPAMGGVVGTEREAGDLP